MQTVTAKMKNELRHLGIDCLCHGFVKVVKGADAAELPSLGRMGHRHHIHKPWDTCEVHRFGAFSSE
jgi:hypothetical protein